MVKVNAPMLSLDASGKLGNALVFAKWKGRNYVRALVTPSNPRSGGQVGMRMMLKFLSQRWTTLSAAMQATWETRAETTVISPFNAYMAYNLARWRNFHSPSIEDPAEEAGTVAVIANEAATAGVRQILVEFDITTANDNWGVLVFRQITTPVVTALTNMVQAVYGADVESFSWIDTPLAAGTYYYNFRAFTNEGVLGAELTEVDATVT